MTTRKYKFTNGTKEWYGRMLRRIRRLSDGKLGGWIEKESNLSHEGDCWVDNDAKVFDNAFIYHDAQVYGGVSIYHNARVYNEAKVFDNAAVYGSAEVSGRAKLSDRARAYDNALISNDALVSGTAYITASLLYQFNIDKIIFYVMEGNHVDYNSYPDHNIFNLIDLWRETVPGINLEKFLKETL